MQQNSPALPLRGHTFFEGQTPPTTYDNSAYVEGVWKLEKEYPQTLPVGVITPPSSRGVLLYLIRHTDSTALSGGAVIKSLAGSYKKRTDGLTDTANMQALGIVDHLYGTNQIVEHDLFWVVRSGPCWVNKPAGALSAGTRVITNDSGQAVALGTPSTDTEAMNFALNYLGEVITTAASGDAQVLVDIQLETQ